MLRPPACVRGPAYIRGFTVNSVFAHKLDKYLFLMSIMMVMNTDDNDDDDDDDNDGA